MVRGHLKQLCSDLMREHETAVIRPMDEMNDKKEFQGLGMLSEKTACT